MRITHSLAALFGLSLLTACGPLPDAHNSRDSLDWAGSYQGITANGLVTTVTLTSDLRYTVVARTPDAAQATKKDGPLRWSADGGSVTLGEAAGAPRYKVGENVLIPLDTAGGDPRYYLRKQPEQADARITETYWKLVELRGAPVASTGNEPHIILHEATQRYSGSGGCNRIVGGFALQEPQRIHFSKGAATMMACVQGMDVEYEFLQVLEQADSYHLGDGTLQLHRARMAPLAKFEAVYLY